MQKGYVELFFFHSSPPPNLRRYIRLLAMKKVPWPSQSEAEKNAAASLPAILPQIGGHDLYSVAKQKRKLNQELEELKDQLKSIYV